MYFSQTESSKWSSVFLLQSALQQENLGKICRPAMVVEVHGGARLCCALASPRSAARSSLRRARTTPKHPHPYPYPYPYPYSYPYPYPYAYAYP